MSSAREGSIAFAKWALSMERAPSSATKSPMYSKLARRCLASELISFNSLLPATDTGGVDSSSGEKREEEESFGWVEGVYFLAVSRILLYASKSD